MVSAFYVNTSCWASWQVMKMTPGSFLHSDEEKKYTISANTIQTMRMRRIIIEIHAIEPWEKGTTSFWLEHLESSWEVNWKPA